MVADEVRKLSGESVRFSDESRRISEDFEGDLDTLTEKIAGIRGLTVQEQNELENDSKSSEDEKILETAYGEAVRIFETAKKGVGELDRLVVDIDRTLGELRDSSKRSKATNERLRTKTLGICERLENLASEKQP